MTRNQTVSFTQMKDGSVEDFQIIAANDRITDQELPDRIIAHMKLMADDNGAYKISRLDHVLQAATRCEQDGADEDWIFATLMHDLGDLLAPYSHADVAAEMIRPFVREEVVWTVRHHGIFQWHYNLSLPEEKRKSRERFKDSPYYQATIDFCEKWDQCSFDPEYPTKPLEHFLPLIRRVLARKPYSH